MKKRGILYGVAINDSKQPVSKNVSGSVSKCPFYAKWSGMLERCYSKAFLVKWPTYKGCSVCEEWLTFSNFKSWMEHQDWRGKHLDKDILFKGNKVYSPDTCAFVAPEINLFVRESLGSIGDWPIGVYWRKNQNKFVAQCRNPAKKKQETLGYFNSAEQAHLAWLNAKLYHAKILANSCGDPRVASALVLRYSQLPD